MKLTLDGRYNWIGETDRLVYLGKRGVWHQFRKIVDALPVWCEVLDEHLNQLEETALTRCQAGRDGDCTDVRCPQLRDGEPAKSGRHCPLDTDTTDTEARSVPAGRPAPSGRLLDTVPECITVLSALVAANGGRVVISTEQVLGVAGHTLAVTVADNSFVLQLLPKGPTQ